MIENEIPKLPDTLKEKNLEGEIFKNFNKKKFFDVMKSNNIDFDKVIDKKKSYNSDFHKFNYLMKELVWEMDISFIDCAIYLYTDYFKEKSVLECFNEENYHELRQEFSKKHGIDIGNNILRNKVVFNKNK